MKTFFKVHAITSLLAAVCTGQHRGAQSCRRDSRTDATQVSVTCEECAVLESLAPILLTYLLLSFSLPVAAVAMATCSGSWTASPGACFNSAPYIH